MYSITSILFQHRCNVWGSICLIVLPIRCCYLYVINCMPYNPQRTHYSRMVHYISVILYTYRYYYASDRMYMYGNTYHTRTRKCIIVALRLLCCIIFCIAYTKCYVCYQTNIKCSTVLYTIVRGRVLCRDLYITTCIVNKLRCVYNITYIVLKHCRNVCVPICLTTLPI